MKTKTINTLGVSVLALLLAALALPGAASADETNPLERLQSAVRDQSSIAYYTRGELGAQVTHQEETALTFSQDGCEITLKNQTRTFAPIGGATETRTNNSTGHLRLYELDGSATHVYVGNSCESLSLTGTPESTWPGGCLYVVVQQKNGRALLSKDLVLKFAPSDRELATKVAQELTRAIRSCQAYELPTPGTVRVDEGRGVKYTEALSGTPNRHDTVPSSDGRPVR